MNIDLQRQGAARYCELQKRLARPTLSGGGSLMEATGEVREWLPAIIAKYNLFFIADIPCGDCHWMGETEMQGVDYTGYDLLPELIEANQRRFPHSAFRVFNAITEVPEQVDLIICRDLLVHLTFEHGQVVLANFRKSGSRYLAINTFPGVVNAELAESHPGWGWRPLDLEAAPYNLSGAIEGVREVAAGEQWERWMKLYRLN